MRLRVFRVLVLLGNVLELLFRDAARNWRRNLRSVTPALGTMSLLLLLAAACGLIGFAVRNVVVSEARDASVVHVYLREGVSDDEVASLRAKLESDRRVVSVRFISKEEALRVARSRPGLPGLANDAATNPFPASLEARLRTLQDAGPVATAVSGDPAVDPTFPTSYDADTYRNLQRFLTLAGSVALAAVLLLALLSTAVTVNAIRAAILTRRDDIATMRLVGASGWMIRGPFVFEGALTGTVAGLLAAVAVVALFALAQAASARTFSQVLPGVDWRTAAACAAGALTAGAALGSLASLVGVRGLRT
jgi:cell division transport system permease protein